MKQIIYILLTTTVLGLMSCSDWLDVSPKTSIPTDKQFESESGFKDALTGIYLKLGTKTLYAGDLTYAYLDELAGLYSDYPGYNTNAVFNQSIVFDYENMFLSKKNGIYSAMYNVIANINNFLEYVDKNKDVLVTERYYETMGFALFFILICCVCSVLFIRNILHPKLFPTVLLLIKTLHLFCQPMKWSMPFSKI